MEGNGAGPTWNTITAARFCTEDVYNPGTSYPVPVPPSGEFRYSFWKSHALSLTGTFTKINNVRWYTDGGIAWALGDEGSVMVALLDAGPPHGCPDGSYDQAGGTVDANGFYFKDATNGHTYYKGESALPGDVASYTSGSPLSVDTADHTTPERTKHVVLQVKVDDNATQGEKTDETFYWKYDEI